MPIPQGFDENSKQNKRDGRNRGPKATKIEEAYASGPLPFTIFIVSNCWLFDTIQYHSGLQYSCYFLQQSCLQLEFGRCVCLVDGVEGKRGSRVRVSRILVH